jgi:hypothetical protein
LTAIADRHGEALIVGGQRGQRKGTRPLGNGRAATLSIHPHQRSLIQSPSVDVDERALARHVEQRADPGTTERERIDQRCRPIGRDADAVERRRHQSASFRVGQISW